MGMGRRLRTSVAGIALAALLAACDPPPPTAERVGPPQEIAVIGDSISQATGANGGGQGGMPGEVRPANSWATGTAAGLGSVLQRIAALPGGEGVTGLNLSANGADMVSDFVDQVQRVPATTDLVLVQMGGNDLCGPSEAAMTPVEAYRAELREGLEWLDANRPDTLVFLSSVPDIYALWYVRGAWSEPRPSRGFILGSEAVNAGLARLFWDNPTGLVIPCESLLEDPTNPRNSPGPTPDPNHPSEARRLRVRARNIAYNQVLAEECARYLRCRYDGGALFDFSSNRGPDGVLLADKNQWQLVDGDISTQDHFHPSFSGQQKLAEVAFTFGFDFTDRSAPTVALEQLGGGGWRSGGVTVRVSGADDVGVRGLEVRLHRPGGEVGAWQEVSGAVHDVVVAGEGLTYVQARAVDVNGNVSASAVLSVRIDDTAPTVTITSPADGAVVDQGEQVTVAFTCADASSNLASCDGTQADGTPLATATAGVHELTVRAVDNAGNVTVVTHRYEVRPTPA